MYNPFSLHHKHTSYFIILKHGAWKSQIRKNKDHCLLTLLAKPQVKHENMYFHLLIYLWEAQLG